ncbi:unnamed protein product [Ilex paraguariensis]|uniref:Uncharacterized protein n=1 Tax=Ilex paraguariensis TaxID=185542 RepID=A0ABC8U9F5_9AQUA
MAQLGGWRPFLTPRRSKKSDSLVPADTSRVLLPWEQSDCIRLGEIKRKKDFGRIEIINEKMMNFVAGLELHTGVFNAEEQKVIVDTVYELQKKGKEGKIKETLKSPYAILHLRQGGIGWLKSFY